MKKLVAVLFLLLSFSFLAAQETDEEGRLIKYREKTVIDFEDVMLEGQIKKPSGSFLMDRSKTKFNSLINLKQDFNKELVRSVDLLN
ncbi:hypothetical protein J5681_09090 [bacterium]|jgi:hypothetical protein|nr:hypothetical protein [bacterium]MBP5592505.1 hypothetical protein [bacterium]MBQ3367804.1 hypothetical protein [bacterium]MBQ4438302.1 hypothetical protein [bacterium]MBR4531513.1 hypothetical protein [bacterium]